MKNQAAVRFELDVLLLQGRDQDHWVDAIGTHNVTIVLTDDSLVFEVDAVNGTLIFVVNSLKAEVVELRTFLEKQSELIMNLKDDTMYIRSNKRVSRLRSFVKDASDLFQLRGYLGKNKSLA